MSSRLVLHLPSKLQQRIDLPYLTHVPEPIGQRRPNGSTMVIDEACPTSLYKFTPWRSSSLPWNEIETCAKLNQLNSNGIVKLLGVSGTSTHLVQKMERAHQGSLDKFLFDATKGEFRQVRAELARWILLQVAEAMAEFHALNLVHRDLKSENILVFGESANVADWKGINVKVSDFDRAIEIAQGESLQDPVGSLFHMAPELLAWEQYDRKVDIYAFGILMYEVAHGGAAPYMNVGNGMPDSMPRVDFVNKVVRECFRPVWLHENVNLKQLAEQCWAQDADDRPEFKEVLEILKSDVPSLASGRSDKAERSTATNELMLNGIGIASHIGKKRLKMEDAVSVLQTNDVLIACAFDGLLGTQCSELAARRFAMALQDELTRVDDTKTAMANTFRVVDAALKGVEPAMTCGSTAVIALVREKDVLLSWLGDSPAYLFSKSSSESGFTVAELIDPHHPDREDEAARVTREGGVVGKEQRWLDNGDTIPVGPARVFVPEKNGNAGIALSRAFGLFSYKPVIGDEPEMVEIAKQDNHLFLVLGSDGVFDLLDTTMIYQIAIDAESSQQAADMLIQEVLRRGAPDNASVIVISLV